MNVTLRQRKKGNKISLYLDYYSDGKREYEYLNLYLTPEPEKGKLTKEQKDENRKKLSMAEAIRSKRLLEIKNEGNQLYMILSFSPKTELGWFAKDEFQSWAFYNSFIRFQRNTAGKVISLHLHLSEEQFFTGIKK